MIQQMLFTIFQLIHGTKLFANLSVPLGRYNKYVLRETLCSIKARKVLKVEYLKNGQKISFDVQVFIRHQNLPAKGWSTPEVQMFRRYD